MTDPTPSAFDTSAPEPRVSPSKARPMTRAERAEQHRLAFEAFDAANPAVWRAFLRYTFEAVRAGWKHLSAQDVLGRVRWDYTVQITATEFRINNNHVAFYVRKFQAMHPANKDLFQTRSSLADQDAA